MSKQQLLNRLDHLKDAVENIADRIKTTKGEIKDRETMWHIECELKQVANHAVYLIKTMKNEDIDIWTTRKAINQSLECTLDSKQ